MKTKVLQVFYNENGLPFKDQERTVHFPIVGSGFMGASNTTQIKFYFKEIGDDAVKYVAVSKLPNGKVGSKVLENYFDSELNEPYALLELDSYYTQYKGDLFISLQGYQGGVQVTYDEDTELYEIEGTPTIQATGSIKFTNNYATQFVGSGEEQNITLQQLLAIISDTVLRYYVNSSNTLAEVFNEIGTKICAIDIEGDEYLVEMSGNTNIVIYDIHNQEWYAFSGANTTTIDEVMSSDNKQIIATKEDLENFGNLFTYKGNASVSEINALTDIGNGWCYNLTDSGTLTLGNLQVEQGDNVAFNGTIWTKLSSETVLGNYYTKQEGQEFEQDVNNQIDAIENQVQQVASGSPKGVYATLSDLETAFPTGTTGIYVVSGTGHWYYWNGSAWTDGGTYQATQISISDITGLENTIYSTKDISWEQGQISSGTEAYASNRIRTNFFKADTNYIKINVNIDYWFAFTEYDEALNYVSQAPSWFQASSLLNVNPSHYYRIVLRKANNGDLTPTEGSNATICFSILDKALKNENNIDYILNGENEFTWEQGSISSGIESATNNRIRTVEYKQFVAKQITVSVPAGFKVSFQEYNENKVFVSQGASWENQYILNIKPNYYYRFVMKKDTNANFRPLEGIVFSISANGIYDFVKKYANLQKIDSHIISLLHQGGMNNPYPMNTIENFVYSRKKGFKWMETDVSWTADNVMVISHDDTITDVNNVSVTISQTTYADLMTHQFFSDSSIKIPKLADVLQSAKKYGYNLALEIKNGYAAHSDALNNLYDMIAEYNMKDNVIVQSWSIGYLRDMAQYGGYTDIKYLVASNSLLDPDNLADEIVYVANHSKGLYLALNRGTVGDANITDEIISKYRKNKLLVNIFLCDTPELIEQYANKVDSVTSNYYSVEQLINDLI